ncbi:hypothetical protein ACOI1H_18990 [Loktanella sp. DJP18]|uniref:hypothetical protein n=1 Tax=Loktanella sp. DJP18 TaxID=3409788 RepID=UPI003BB5E5F1
MTKTEENYRLDVAFAAIEVAGTSDRHFMLGEVLPAERRTYLYAVPEGEADSDAHNVETLAKALIGADVPHAVDWDRSSKNFGLRYLPDFVKVPESLMAFTLQAAKTEWSAWRAREEDASRVVSELASELLRYPNYQLDAARQSRIADRATDMIDRRKTTYHRRSLGDERA